MRKLFVPPSPTTAAEIIKDSARGQIDDDGKITLEFRFKGGGAQYKTLDEDKFKELATLFANMCNCDSDVVALAAAIHVQAAKEGCCKEAEAILSQIKDGLEKQDVRDQLIGSDGDDAEEEKPGE